MNPITYQYFGVPYYQHYTVADYGLYREASSCFILNGLYCSWLRFS